MIPMEKSAKIILGNSISGFMSNRNKYIFPVVKRQFDNQKIKMKEK